MFPNMSGVKYHQRKAKEVSRAKFSCAFISLMFLVPCSIVFPPLLFIAIPFAFAPYVAFDKYGVRRKRRNRAKDDNIATLPAQPSALSKMWDTFKTETANLSQERKAILALLLVIYVAASVIMVPVDPSRQPSDAYGFLGLILICTCVAVYKWKR